MWSCMHRLHGILIVLNWMHKHASTTKGRTDGSKWPRDRGDQLQKNLTPGNIYIFFFSFRFYFYSITETPCKEKKICLNGWMLADLCVLCLRAYIRPNQFPSIASVFVVRPVSPGGGRGDKPRWLNCTWQTNKQPDFVLGPKYYTSCAS